MGFDLTRDLVGQYRGEPKFLENIEHTVYHMESLEVQYKTMRLPSVAPEEAGVPREAGQDTVMRQPLPYRDSNKYGGTTASCAVYCSIALCFL